MRADGRRGGSNSVAYCPIGTVVSLVQFWYSNTIRSPPVLYNSLRNRLSRIVYSVRIGPPQPKFLCLQLHPQNLQPNGPFLMPRTAAPAARQNYGTTAELSPGGPGAFACLPAEVSAHVPILKIRTLERLAKCAGVPL